MYLYIYLCNDRPPSRSHPQSVFALFPFASRFVFAADTVLWVWVCLGGGGIANDPPYLEKNARVRSRGAEQILAFDLMTMTTAERGNRRAARPPLPPLGSGDGPQGDRTVR